MKTLMVNFTSKAGNHKFIFKVNSENDLKKFINFVVRDYYPNNDFTYSVKEINNVLKGDTYV